MAYFDKQKETLVTVDASPVGVSAILSQKTKRMDDENIVAYASRALTDVEKRYSQTEKEALAIIYGVEHFHLSPSQARVTNSALAFTYIRIMRCYIAQWHSGIKSRPIRHFLCHGRW